MNPKQSADYENMLNATRRSLDNARTINILVDRAQRAEDRVLELEAFIRPFAVGPHDIECEAAYGTCTCVVDSARKVLGIPLECSCTTALEGQCSGCRAVPLPGGGEVT